MEFSQKPFEVDSLVFSILEFKDLRQNWLNDLPKVMQLKEELENKKASMYFLSLYLIFLACAFFSFVCVRKIGYRETYAYAFVRCG